MASYIRGCFDIDPGILTFWTEVFDIHHLIGHHIFFLDYIEGCNFNTVAPSKLDELKILKLHFKPQL